MPINRLSLVECGLGERILDYHDIRPRGALDKHTVQATLLVGRSQLGSIAGGGRRARKDCRSIRVLLDDITLL